MLGGKKKRWFPSRRIPRQTVFLHRDPNKTFMIDIFKSNSSKLSIQSLQPDNHSQQEPDTPV